MENKNESLVYKQPSLLQKLILEFLAKIEYGQLILRQDGVTYSFEGLSKVSALKALITVKDRRMYSKIFFQGSIGAAEAYMLGHWESDDLVQVIELIIKNKKILENIETPSAKLINYVYRMVDFFRKNNITRAKKNILAHYDLGNEFFNLFLDSRMMYSCALYQQKELTLEQAALNKLEEICERLQLKKSDHVLEIGSGWGGFAIYAAREYGCKLTTTTISDEQYAYVKSKVRQFKLEDQIEVLNKDYRYLNGQYDKVVSIEMIEAIGHPYFDQFFRCCNALVKPGGLFFLQAITINDEAYERAKNELDFIKKYIFPGGCLPSIYSIFYSVARHTQMQLLHMRDLGQDYALTINHWLEKFNQKENKIREQGFSPEFIRMWRYYFCYCIAAFKQEYISDVHLLWKKRT